MFNVLELLESISLASLYLWTERDLSNPLSQNHICTDKNKRGLEKGEESLSYMAS